MTITDKLQKNHADFSHKVEEIRGDWAMSDAAKLQEIETLYSETSDVYSRLTDEHRTSVREGLHKTRKDVFSAPKLGADGALNMLAYRDALDRTERKTDPRELLDLLARAEVTGDQALAKACLYQGFDLLGEEAKTAIVQSYYSKYPEELPKWEAFMEAAEAHNYLETLGISGATGVPEPERPEELRGAGSGVAKPGEGAVADA